MYSTVVVRLDTLCVFYMLDDQPSVRVYERGVTYMRLLLVYEAVFVSRIARGSRSGDLFHLTADRLSTGTVTSAPHDRLPILIFYLLFILVHSSISITSVYTLHSSFSLSHRLLFSICALTAFRSLLALPIFFQASLDG